MTEIRTLKGPLGDRELGWIADLYGPVDRKYASLDFLRHQFCATPFGWSLHAFAVADGSAVAHSGAVPMRARIGDEPTIAGKVEALVVAEAHRGRRPDGTSLAVELLETLARASHDEGIALVFALAAPHAVGAFVRAGFERITVDAPTYVLVTSARGAAAGHGVVRRAVMTAVSLGQRALLVTAAALARGFTGPTPEPRVEPVAPEDVELVRDAVAPGKWTIAPADAWDWYAASGLLEAVELAGRFGSRAIVRRGERGGAVQLVAWHPARPGLLPALLLLDALARLARRRAAATVRFQPWPAVPAVDELARACMLLGFVRRGYAEIQLSAAPGMVGADDVELSPFFYVTF